MAPQYLWKMCLNHISRSSTLQFTGVHLRSCDPRRVGFDRFLMAVIITQLLTKVAAKMFLGIIHGNFRQNTIMLEE